MTLTHEKKTNEVMVIIIIITVRNNIYNWKKTLRTANININKSMKTEKTHKVLQNKYITIGSHHNNTAIYILLKPKTWLLNCLLTMLPLQWYFMSIPNFHCIRTSALQLKRCKSSNWYFAANKTGMYTTMGLRFKIYMNRAFSKLSLSWLATSERNLKFDQSWSSILREDNIQRFLPPLKPGMFSCW